MRTLHATATLHGIVNRVIERRNVTAPASPEFPHTSNERVRVERERGTASRPGVLGVAPRVEDGERKVKSIHGNDDARVSVVRRGVYTGAHVGGKG